MAKKTEMLYMKDNYIKDFEAEVLKAGEDYLVLDKTAFYPQGGGQESDTGELEFNETILTVRKVKKEKGEVRHYLKDPSKMPSKGDVIHGRIDWDRRLTHMRYHTAIHVLTRYMQLHYDADCVGNNISTRNGRADFHPLGALSDDQLKVIQTEVNKIIKKELPVKIQFMPREEAITFLKKKGYQTDYIDMIPASVKTFRIISVDDYDYASCAGTHVKNTSEIKSIKVVKRRSMGKEKERIVLDLV
jgi:Ser-tRNA(Ala) deacylase AlaX